MSRLIHVGLGANLGDAEKTITSALAQLATWADQHDARSEFKHSKLFRSASLGAPGPDYINAVAQFNCPLAGEMILSALQRIENSFGRTRSFPNAPRTLDLDLLLIENETIQSPHLTVPHPRMTERAFVLKPLAELQPNLSLTGTAIQELLRRTTSQKCEPLFLGE